MNSINRREFLRASASLTALPALPFREWKVYVGGNQSGKTTRLIKDYMEKRGPKVLASMNYHSRLWLKQNFRVDAITRWEIQNRIEHGEWNFSTHVFFDEPTDSVGWCEQFRKCTVSTYPFDVVRDSHFRKGAEVIHLKVPKKLREWMERAGYDKQRISGEWN